MANVYAVKSGNWSDTTVWNTGALPTSADDVFANTFTVTIDVSPTVLSIRNGATTGVTAGGSFLITTSGITLTSAIIHTAVANNVNLLNINVTNPGIATIIGDVGGAFTPGFSTNGISHNSTGTVNLVGTVAAGGNLGNAITHAVVNASSGVINFTGNCTGGRAANFPCHGILNNSSGIVNITGDCIGGLAPISGSLTTSGGAANSGSGTINITGNCSGGPSASPGAINLGTGSMVCTGSILASSNGPGVGTGSASQVTILTGPLISSDGSGGTAHSSGVNPCVAARWFPADTALGTFEYRMRGQTVSDSPGVRPARQLFLTDAYDATYPNAVNVRSATTYGPGDIYTGTCAVPPAGSVAFGVPVDDTTGTAAIDGPSIRAAIGLATANLDTQLDALPTAAENATAAWAAGSRTITGGTVDTLTNAPDVPTPEDIATQVREELDPELERISNCSTVDITGAQIAALF